jgi:hypothetical protein
MGIGGTGSFSVALRRYSSCSNTDDARSSSSGLGDEVSVLRRSHVSFGAVNCGSRWRLLLDAVEAMLWLRAIRISVSVMPSIFCALFSRSLLLENILLVDGSASVRFLRSAEGRRNRGEGAMIVWFLGSVKDRKVVALSGREGGGTAIMRSATTHHCSQLFIKRPRSRWLWYNYT